MNLPGFLFILAGFNPLLETIHINFVQKSIPIFFTTTVLRFRQQKLFQFAMCQFTNRRETMQLGTLSKSISMFTYYVLQVTLFSEELSRSSAKILLRGNGVLTV